MIILENGSCTSKKCSSGKYLFTFLSVLTTFLWMGRVALEYNKCMPIVGI